MTFALAYTLTVLALSIALFISDRFRLDVVALLSLLALVLGGILPFDEAVQGFSSPLVLMIAGLFVIGAGLTETGVADWLGNKLGNLARGGEVGLLVVVMLATAGFSAFMSSTGTVAILLPVVGSMAQRRGIPLSRVLLPLAFSAHLGSLLTLIATPPNLVVAEALVAAGAEPLRFFSLSPIGLIILALGIAYMILVGRKKLPAGNALGALHTPLTLHDFARDYGIEDITTLRVLSSSALVGKTLGEADIRARFGVNVVGIETPQGGRGRRVIPRTSFAPQDLLYVQSAGGAVSEMAREWGLQIVQEKGRLTLAPGESLVEVVVTRRSSLEGKTPRELRFRDRYRATVLGVRRGAEGETIQVVQDEPLQIGDLLLLKGRRRHLRNLRDEREDFIVVAAPDPPTDLGIRRWPAIQALAVTTAMLVVMAFGLLPHAVAVVSAAVILVLVNAVRPADAYRAINWESVVLIAAMLPMATALERTGATSHLIAAMERSFAGGSPYFILALLVLVTSLLGLFISNTATAVLVAPLAAQVAVAMDLSPTPLLVGVAVAASAAFSTPIASPVNSIVAGPGGYHFKDFLRVGAPLHVLVLIVAVVMVPLLFPF